MCQLRPSMSRPHPSFIVSVHTLGKSTDDSQYPTEADPAADRCTTVPPETDVHVQGFPIDVYPGGTQRRGVQCPHLNSRSIPCGSLDTSVSFRHLLFLDFAFVDDTRGTPKDYTVCGDCRLRHYASCQVLRPSTGSVLQVQRWVLTCDAARRASR